MTNKKELIDRLLSDCDENLTVKQIREEAERLLAEEAEQEARKKDEEERKIREKELKVLKEFIINLKVGDIEVVLRDWKGNEYYFDNQLEGIVNDAVRKFTRELGERLEKILPELEKLECDLIQKDDDN